MDSVTQDWENMDSGLVTAANSQDIPCFPQDQELLLESQIPSYSLTSYQLLLQSGTKLKRLRENKINKESPDNVSTSQALSTDQIMKLAKARLLQLNFQKVDVLSSVKGCFADQYAGLSANVAQDLELALLIQAAASKIAEKKFIYARKLLGMCSTLASKSGNPVQRTVYYFAKALKERMDQEWGLSSSKQLEDQGWSSMITDVDRFFLEPVMVECQQELPFCLETQFITTDTILESIASAKKVHLIDFEIDNGSQWILIMQAFADRCEFPLKLLKITAVGPSEDTMKETGKRLSSFAATINLPFLFQMVVSEDLKDIKKEAFEIEPNEIVAVDLAFRLWSLLAWPNHLNAFMKLIKNIKPCIMMLKELEVHTNAPAFLDRFNETLLFCSALFDSTKACMERHVLYRKLLEEVQWQKIIHNVVTAEGTERSLRHEKIGFWRALFKRFDIVEADLSRTSVQQAHLSLKSSNRLRPCTAVMDGKCLIFGWKETSLQSVSAWKVLPD